MNTFRFVRFISEKGKKPYREKKWVAFELQCTFLDALCNEMLRMKDYESSFYSNEWPTYQNRFFMHSLLSCVLLSLYSDSGLKGASLFDKFRDTVFPCPCRANLLMA